MGLIIFAVFAALTAAAPVQNPSEVPQAVIERLKTQEVEVIQIAEIQENGKLVVAAVVYVKPYYLIVQLHRVVEGWTFENADIYEIFLVKDDVAHTIWERSPPK